MQNYLVLESSAFCSASSQKPFHVTMSPKKTETPNKRMIQQTDEWLSQNYERVGG